VYPAFHQPAKAWARHVTATLMLVTAMALVMTASASAIGPISNEASGVQCSAINPPASHGPGTGGCPVKAINSGKIEVGTALGMILCDSTFEGRINSNGEGYIYNHIINGCSPANMIPCGSASEQGTPIWPVELTSETNLEGSFCVVAFGITLLCHMPTITVTLSSGSHIPTYTSGPSHQFCEHSVNSVQGTWTGIIDAAHPAIESEG
jgi:hypothetical protein